MKIALVCAFMWMLPVQKAFCEEPDIFDFFAAEAEAIRVVTASRLPLSVRQAPATVYVVTGEELLQMGIQTLWDALRSVPGVDVMATRTFYGEVSIRGLNKALNNRTLVLLDGKPVLNGPFDSTFWEGLPVAINAIDRIEVALGPASALYGANAINGVINIITKTPEQLKGGAARYAVGQRRTHLTDAAYGNRKGGMGYLTGVEYRATHQFEHADRRASAVGKVHGRVDIDLPGDTRMSFSGGLSDYQTQFAIGVSPATYDGTTGFVRADMYRKGTHLRTYWNREQPRFLDLASATVPEIRLDSREVLLEQTFALNARHSLVVGGSGRHNAIQSNVYSPERVRQTLWALFVEYAWQPAPNWTVISSGRVDRYALTGWMVSPRASLVYSPTAQHVFRLATGTAFRNPTLTESYLMQEQFIQTPFNLQATFELVGNVALEPERVRQVEAAYTGRFGPLRTTAVGFHYRLDKMIGVGKFALVPEALPQLRARAQYQNIDDRVRAWGGELGFEIEARPGAVLFANYAYQHIRGTFEFQVAENGGPAHKVNGGMRLRRGGFSTSLWAHGVARTAWSDASALNLAAQYSQIDGYVLLNIGAGYAFSGALEGLSLGLQVFNVTDKIHYQTLPARSDVEPGLSGEIMRRRLTAAMSCRF